MSDVRLTRHQQLQRDVLRVRWIGEQLMRFIMWRNGSAYTASDGFLVVKEFPVALDLIVDYSFIAGG